MSTKKHKKYILASASLKRAAPAVAWIADVRTWRSGAHRIGQFLSALKRALRRPRLRRVRGTRASLRSIGIGVLCVIFLAAVVSRMIQKHPVYGTSETRTVNIFPSVYISDTWHNPIFAVSQDVSADAPLDQFTIENSAFVTADREYQERARQETKAISEDIPPETHIDIQEVPASDVPPPEAQTPETQEPKSEPVIVPDMGGLEPINFISEPASEPVPPSAPAPESAPSPEEQPLADGGAPISFFKFRSFILTRIARAQDVPPENMAPVTGGETSPAVSSSAETASSDEAPTTEPVQEPEVIVETPPSESGAGDQPAVSESSIQEEPSPAEPASAETEVSSEVFPSSSSEVDVSEQSPILVEPAERGEFSSNDFHAYIGFSDFALADEMRVGTIENAQLRFSLGAKNYNPNEGAYKTLKIEYFHDGVWAEAGEISLAHDISNAANGGYFLYALPIFSSWDELENFQIRFSYVDAEGVATSDVYLESMWLEIASRSPRPDPEVRDDIVIESVRVPMPKATIEAFSKKNDFGVSENPEFTFEFKSQKNIFKRAFRSLFGIANDYAVKSFELSDSKGRKVPIAAAVIYDSDARWSFKITDRPRSLQPGLYTLIAQIQEGENPDDAFLAEYQFYWGVLAANTNKSVYASGEDAYIQMAALTAKGHTICDAILRLEITDPESHVAVYSTQDGTISQSGECAPENVVSVPDYFAHYQTRKPGKYKMVLSHLERKTLRLLHVIEDGFEVYDEVL